MSSICSRGAQLPLWRSWQLQEQPRRVRTSIWSRLDIIQRWVYWVIEVPCNDGKWWQSDKPILEADGTVAVPRLNINTSRACQLMEFQWLYLLCADVQCCTYSDPLAPNAMWIQEADHFVPSEKSVESIQALPPAADSEFLAASSFLHFENTSSKYDFGSGMIRSISPKPSLVQSKCPSV